MSRRSTTVKHAPYTHPGSTCADHADAPSGYVARTEWMEEMSKTHKQRRCAQCGFWMIWVPL